ncbi:MAG TPA: efflux RND transporter periplasmic adaptor subunit [Gemmatimonadaceae bacterium]|nr:efflux RND transporter periplasmic adaptor subunit [Gemmatimonadaceae bacterium]
MDNRYLALLAVVGLTACKGSAPADAATTPQKPSSAFMLTEDQKARIHTLPIVPSTFRPTVITTGTVAFNGDRSTPVLSQISGPVTRILVNTGTYVHPGTPLAKVTSPDFAEGFATYQKAQTALRNTARIATLNHKLFDAGAIAKSDLDQSVADSASAAADRDAAIEQMVAYGVDSSTIRDIEEGKPTAIVGGVIRSPIEGVVVEKLINPGQVIQAGQTQCFTVADLSTVWVMANVFESQLSSVDRGESAVITTDASPDSFPGRVDYIAAIVDTSTRATAVRIVAENHRQILKRDLYVRVAIHSDRPKTGMLVPVSAVLRDEENLPFVFVQEKDGGFNRRSITLGSRVGDQYEVTAGLAANDQVVTEGGLFIQFAQSQ